MDEMLGPSLQDDLRELKKEVIETRNMNIKTDNRVQGLFGEVKKISAAQEDFESRWRKSTIGAYLLFLIVVSAASGVIMELRVNAFKLEVEKLETDLATLTEADRQKKLVLDARDAADVAADNVLRMIRDNQKETAIAEFAKLSKERLTPAAWVMLEEKVETLRLEMAEKHYQKGLADKKIGGYTSAVQEFDVSLSYHPHPRNHALILFHKGESLYKKKKYDEAITVLNESLTLDGKHEQAPMAELLIGLCYEESGNCAEALKQFDNLLAKNWGHIYRGSIQYHARLCRNKLAEGNR